MTKQRLKRKQNARCSRELAWLKTNNHHFASITSNEIQNPYEGDIPGEDDVANAHLEEFIHEADQDEVLEFAYKAKVLHQTQQLSVSLDSVRNTLADIESAEASTASQISSLTNLSNEAQERFDSRLDEINITVQNNSDGLKKFEAAVEQLGTAVLQVQNLETTLASSLNEKVGSTMNSVAQGMKEEKHQLSNELLSHVRDAYNRLSGVTEAIEKMKSTTHSLNSRLEEALQTIPKELSSLRETLKNTKPLNISPEEIDALKKSQQKTKDDSQLTREYTEWRDYYSTFSHMYRITSLSDIKFIWLFLDHIPNEALSLQIQRNLCTARHTKAYVRLRQQPNGRRRIDLSSKTTWGMVKAVVKATRFPIPKFVQS